MQPLNSFDKEKSIKISYYNPSRTIIYHYFDTTQKIEEYLT